MLNTFKKTLKAFLADDRGMGTVEVMVIATILGVLAYAAYSQLKTPATGAAGTLGNKVNNLAGGAVINW
ncbi:hypothetical protein SDD30_14245 [Moorella naiadis]|uniref:hypothetical protein n=1 Tax=Moorella naiadis (nom. illeg.) TaxID=3093670 RepID=UPI003D9CAD81